MRNKDIIIFTTVWLFSACAKQPHASVETGIFPSECLEKYGLPLNDSGALCLAIIEGLNPELKTFVSQNTFPPDNEQGLAVYSYEYTPCEVPYEYGGRIWLFDLNGSFIMNGLWNGLTAKDCKAHKKAYLGSLP